jgi:hypothetical protein
MTWNVGCEELCIQGISLLLTSDGTTSEFIVNSEYSKEFS